MRRLIIGLVMLLVVVAAVSVASPVEKVEAANGCGPSALSLYVIIPDNIYYFHVFRWQWETFNFTGACNNHDDCYDSSGIDRATCDTRFYNDMLAVCNRGWTSGSRTWCRGWAWTYYQSVRTFGSFAYTP